MRVDCSNNLNKSGFLQPVLIRTLIMSKYSSDRWSMMPIIIWLVLRWVVWIQTRTIGNIFPFYIFVRKSHRNRQLYEQSQKKNTYTLKLRFFIFFESVEVNKNSPGSKRFDVYKKLRLKSPN